MALAILELVALEEANVRFKIDTGTNRYYQLKIGRAIRRKNGIDWVDDLYFSSPLSINPAGGELLRSVSEISIPLKQFDRGRAYVQLFSFKTREKTSPAFSRVIEIPMGASALLADPPADFALPFSRRSPMTTIASFHAPRTIPCRSEGGTYSQAASLDDILGTLLKVAVPVVQNLLGGAQNNPPAGAPAGTTAPAGETALPALLARWLTSIVGGLGAGGATMSQPQSIGVPIIHSNRFIRPEAEFSQPFFWQALLGAAIGPLIQALPQLANAAIQKRIQMKQADNKLITDILSTVNQRRLLEQLLEAQRQVPSGGSSENAANLTPLIQLLQQMPAASQQPAAEATPPPVAVSTSQSRPSAGYAYTFSNKAVLSFVTADPVRWNGTDRLLFSKNQGVQLKIRFTVGEPAPKTPLPKAILKVVFKNNADQSVLYEKQFQQKNLEPNSVLPFSFSPEELAPLPLNRPIAVFAEIRWLSPKTSREYRALGSSEMVMVDKHFLKEKGNALRSEQELTDMNRFRVFWNKVWEAPLLNRAGTDQGEKKYLWEANLNLKYFVYLSIDQESNGLMETKILREQPDEESLSEKIAGRMKSGIELSLSELNQLIPLWNGAPALNRDQLDAFKTDLFRRDNAGEFQYHVRLKGKAGQRGMVWVVPIFKLFEFILGTVQKADDAGQVISVSEETVRFPLPIAARVIGLKST
ncbi:MAG: hypothetical protein CV087_05005 [Candidatus Brocadia sp. WS118]|nr:MAG: hypothetical protein CV087_05005 [Candidatus Brocadia sp. WS118]